jgi:hypothetical protein
MAFPRSVRPADEDATPESAAFGDQAPRAVAAWSDSRPDSAPSSDAGAVNICGGSAASKAIGRFEHKAFLYARAIKRRRRG